MTAFDADALRSGRSAIRALPLSVARRRTIAFLTMRRTAGAAGRRMRALVVSLAVLVVACASTQPNESLPTPERVAGDVRAGAIDPAAFDFARAGYRELDAAPAASV